MTVQNASTSTVYTAVLAGKLQGGSWMRESTREAHKARCGDKCAFCGADVSGLYGAHMAHMTPRCKGGKNGPDNVLALCSSCNEAMGGMSLAEYCATLPNGAEVEARARAILALALPRAAGRERAAEAKAARQANPKAAAAARKAARKARNCTSSGVSRDNLAAWL